jgi:ABC-2 type transport system ATP-binding protein
VALDNIDLAVPRGLVFGLVGENGAGKTTLIKHLLGLLKPETGSVRVFGLDPIQKPEEVLGRIGYLSENRDLPNWMRVRELMLYTQAFYPKWDERYAEDLRKVFNLDPSARIRSLSRGQRAQAGLLIALAHRPELLLLDEPSSGLDPVVRRDILTAIIRTVAEEGRTVLFSSHLLEEVERVADYVAMIHKGRIALAAPLDEIKERHCRITLRFSEAHAAPPALPGPLWWEGRGNEWSAVCDGRLDALKQAVNEMNAQVVEEGVPSLEEIFVAQVKAGQAPSRED